MFIWWLLGKNPVCGLIMLIQYDGWSAGGFQYKSLGIRFPYDEKRKLQYDTMRKLPPKKQNGKTKTNAFPFNLKNFVLKIHCSSNFLCMDKNLLVASRLNLVLRSHIFLTSFRVKTAAGSPGFRQRDGIIIFHLFDQKLLAFTWNDLPSSIKIKNRLLGDSFHLSKVKTRIQMIYLIYVS